MSQVAPTHTSPSLAVRFRSHRLVWLLIALVAAGSVVTVLALELGGSSSDGTSNSTPAVQQQPAISAPHPDEGAPLRYNSGGNAFSQRPQEGQAPINRQSPGSAYTPRPQEGSAPIRSESTGSAYTQRPQEGQAPIRLRP